ncbi:MAG: hypothetical protein ACK4E7_08345 [Permianibacter sp.]
MSYVEAYEVLQDTRNKIDENNGVCFTGQFEEVEQQVTSWMHSSGKGGPAIINHSMRVEFSIKGVMPDDCSIRLASHTAHINEYRSVSCPADRPKYFFNHEEDQYYCYKELCPGQDSNNTPNFPEKSFARWYEADKCPEDFEQQESCQTGGSAFSKYKTENPIACRTGEKLKTEIDYSGPAGLSFTRHYSSMPQLGGAPSALPQWFVADDITFGFVKKAAHGQIAELRFGDGGRLLFVGSGTATTLSSSTAAHGSLSNSTGSWVWSNPKGEKYGFGPGGKVASKTLKNGQVFTYRWEEDGNGGYRLTGVTEPFGRSILVEYNAQGQMSAVVDPAGQRYRYAYDANGNLKTVTFPDETPGNDSDNPAKTYLYEDSRFPHHLTGIIDENGHRYSQYGYDDQGRAILSELGNHAEKVTMEYLETGNTLVQRHQDESRYRETLLVIDRSHGADRVLREEDFACPGCTTGT